MAAVCAITVDDCESRLASEAVPVVVKVSICEVKEATLAEVDVERLAC